MAGATLWSLLLLLEGVGAVDVGVKYVDSACAVRGSSLSLLCSFTPARDLVRVRWCRNHLICQGSTPSVYDSNSKNNDRRYKYLGDRTGNCTLQITDVQKKDEGTLRFRMEAQDTRGHFTGQTGVNVTVTDGPVMTVSSSAGHRRLKTNESVTLFCTTHCTFHQLPVTWFKDGHALSEPGPALQLGPLAAKDSGNYTCGLKTMRPSQPYSLHVEAEEERLSDEASLIAAVAFGVLLALVTLILVLCIIRRRRAAAGDQAGDKEHKPSDTVYSSVLLEGRSHRQETGPAEEEINYASIQLNPKNQTRAVVKVEAESEATVYSSLADRG